MTIAQRVPTDRSQRLVLDWIIRKAPLSLDGQVHVKCRAIAADTDVPLEAVAGVVQALIRQGYLVQIRAHRSGSGGRRPRARIVTLA